MRLSNFLDGVAILRPYYDNPDGHHIESGYEQITMAATNRPLSPDDVVKMAELDWLQPEIAEDGEWKPSDYDPAEPWAAFT